MLLVLDVIAASHHIAKPVAVVGMHLNYWDPFWNYGYKFVNAQQFVRAARLYTELPRPLL